MISLAVFLCLMAEVTFKDYLPYKMITSQKMSSEAQLMDFFIL